MDKTKMGNFLVRLRTERNLKQQDVAEIFKVSPQAVSKWESGESVPDIGTLEKLSDFYKVGIDEIINGELKNPNANVSTVVVAKSPTLEDRGIGKPYYGAFIFSMSALALALIFSFFPYIPLTGELNGTTYTFLFNFYEVLFKSTGTAVVFAWVIAVTFVTETCMSIGLWLSPKGRRAFWFWEFGIGLANVGLNFYFFGQLLGASERPIDTVPLQTGSVVLAVLSFAYFILFLTLPITRKRTFCPKKKKGEEAASR